MLVLLRELFVIKLFNAGFNTISISMKIKNFRKIKMIAAAMMKLEGRVIFSLFFRVETPNYSDALSPT